MTNIQALLLGVLEGLTEFLPISSTGHLTLFSYFLNIVQNNEFILFQIAIQLGAICAVILFYFKKLFQIETIKLLIIGFIPTGLIGFFIFPYIKYLLTNELIIVSTLILGGILILIIENWRAKYDYKNKLQNNLENKNINVDREIDKSMDTKTAFLLGLAQSIAIIPGVSRSGAVVMTGLLLKLDRVKLTEFTFLLAVPTMSAATLYSLYKSRDILVYINWLNFAIGFVTSFIVAILVIKLFLNYIKKYDFKIFGLYRIILGLVILFFYL